jgi:5-methylcytosine-specific restriction endonuclease McrA
VATRNLSPTIKAGALFPKMAHGSFMELTGSRYRGMLDRLKRKKLPPPGFTLEEFRADVLKVTGGEEDGPIECRYCKRVFTLQEIAIDHATPISRAGSLELDNIDYPCKQCNDRKGSMTMTAYIDLLRYLDTIHPLDRQDVLSRLEKANKLAAGARRTQALAAELERMKGSKPAKPDPMRELPTEF